MKLQSIKINNFRNITSAEYNMKDINIFHGPNATGKTNTILAVYWALADYLMDGTADYPTFKPHADPAAKVSVELVFDSFSFKKTYKEKWVKTRGSSDVRLEGHTTDYFIDEVKYPVTEGKRLLLENLGLDDVKVSNRVDIIRAVVDPYYLAQQLPWKDLRIFIIDLVGDADDETVLNSNEAFSKIKEDLEKQKYNTSSLSKLYKQIIRKNKDEITANENYVVAYEKVEDVAKTDLDKANINIELLDDEIARLRTQKASDVNPNIQLIENEIAKIRVEFLDSRDADNKEMASKNAEVNKKIESLSKKLEEHKNNFSELKGKQATNNFEIKQYELDYKGLYAQLEQKQKERENLAETWEKLDAQEFHSSIQENKCPHCGGVLNEDELASHQKAWEVRKEKDLADVVERGNAAKNEIDNLTFKIQELKKPEEKDFNVAIDYEVKNIEEVSKDIEAFKDQLITDYESDKTKELKAKGFELTDKLEEEKAVKTEDDVQAKILEKQKEKARHQKVVDEHNAYLITQKRIVETQETIEALQTGLIDNETKLMLLEEFIKTKLEMLKTNVASVFGDLEFVLIETNIKEGSYTEVCYPLILGQKTPFSSGSGAEKIVTGVNIIESVKAKLGLKNVPIIFDEADRLDTQTLATKLDTDSQIISTKVDDINYDKVELVTK